MWLNESKFAIHKFRQKYGIDPPERYAILAGHNKLLGTGSVLRKKGSGKQSLDDVVIENIQQSFQRSPCKSIHRVSHELGIPRSTVHDVVHKRLKFRSYKIGDSRDADKHIA